MVGRTIHDVEQVDAAESLGFEPGAKLGEPCRGRTYVEVVRFDDQDSRVLQGLGSPCEDRELEAVRIQLNQEGSLQAKTGNLNVDRRQRNRDSVALGRVSEAVPPTGSPASKKIWPIRSPAAASTYSTLACCATKLRSAGSCTRCASTQR